MPPLYNKEFSVNFEPSSFDKFFSFAELVNETISTVFQIYRRKTKYINVRQVISTYRQKATQQKRKSGKTRSF